MASFMTTDDVLEEFRASGALREGHFVLSSGLHSGVFLQKNLVFQYPDRTERLCKALAEKITGAVGERQAAAHGLLPRRGGGAADIMAGCTDVLMNRKS